jgi:membrane protein
MVTDAAEGDLEGSAKPEHEQSAKPDDGAPSTPTRLPAKAWLGAIRRTVAEYGKDNLSDRAAALTYYAVLSVFPALLVLVSLVGLAGPSATQTLISNVQNAAPAAVRQILTTGIRNLQSSRNTAGLLAIVGLAAALWSASGYVAAFMRASNVIYDVPEGRPIWKTLPIRVAVTVLQLVLLTASALMVVFTGGLAERAGRALGIGHVAVSTWDVVKWPILLFIVSFMFALLYWASPNAKQPFRWVTPGGILAVIVWLLASGAFAFYVADFGSYNKTYGSLAGVVIFLVWLWISNIAILLGAEMNAELERSRAITAGHPKDEEPYVELRDTRKIKKAST